MSSRTDSLSTRPTIPGRLGAVVGVAGLGATGLLYGASGLVAPFWAVGLLVGFWAALVFAALRWFSVHPWRVLLLPVLAYLVWLLVVSAGGAWLGWTA